MLKTDRSRSSRNRFFGIFKRVESLLFKLNSIKTLILRAHAVNTTFTGLNKEFSFLVDFFFNNGFPKYVVYKEINKFIKRIQHPTPTVPTVEKRKVYASIGYYGKISESLKAEINKLIETVYPQVDFRLCLVNGFTINSMFSFKDSLPIELRSSIIYKYSCAHCASGTYVGSTMRAAYMRFAEHEGISFCTGLPLNHPKHSSIREHTARCGPFDQSKFAIIGQEKSEVHLRILESLFIQQEKPKLNDMQSSFPLYIVK